MICASVSLSGSIDPAAQLIAELLTCDKQEDFPLTGFGMRAAQTVLGRQTDCFGKLHSPLQALLSRHLPDQLDQRSPRFRGCVGWSHHYIIATGGAGSLGSPAFLSGIATRKYAIKAMNTIPTQ